MKRIVPVAAFALSVAVAAQLAPAQTSTANTQRSVWTNRLVPPVYPPLARQARIAGDVQVRIGIRRDGSVASAEVVSGHPMLQQAALASAQKSTFSCSPECTDEVTTVLFTYTFGLREGGSCFYDVFKLRSRRCLYLWRCGMQQKPPSPSAPPAIGTAPNQVIILADTACVETESSSSQ